MKAWAYDLMYRSWAPWDAVGVRPDLRRLVDTGRVTSRSHPHAVDLGCGTGANVVYLAQQGFASTGVDFSGSHCPRRRLEQTAPTSAASSSTAT